MESYGHVQANNVGQDYLQRQALNQKSATAGQIAPVPNRASEAMFHEISQRFSFLNDVLARLELLTDRACGCVPCDPKTQPDRGVPNTLNEKISIVIPMLDEVNARILGAVQRLESFV